MPTVESHTNLSGLGYPSGRSTTALKTLNIAVFMPIATAKVRMTTAAKPL